MEREARLSVRVDLRNEDLVPGRINLKGGLLEKVGGFLGINPQKFDPDTYSQAQVEERFWGCKGVCKGMIGYALALLTLVHVTVPPCADHELQQQEGLQVQVRQPHDSLQGSSKKESGVFWGSMAAMRHLRSQGIRSSNMCSFGSKVPR